MESPVAKKHTSISQLRTPAKDNSMLDTPVSVVPEESLNQDTGGPDLVCRDYQKTITPAVPGWKGSDPEDAADEVNETGVVGQPDYIPRSTAPPGEHQGAYVFAINK